MPGEHELIEERRQKLARLRERGVDPYPPRTERTHTAAEAVATFERWEAAVAEGGAQSVSVAGRIAALRDMGKAAFADLQDGSGRIQCYLKKDVLGADAYDALTDLDLGDFLGITGRMFRTKTGQVTVEAEQYAVLAKALRPPPEKWHGVADVETRYRQRYLDLMANEETREVFRTRSAIIARIRRFMDDRGFI